jgi:streptogramin lyase
MKRILASLTILALMLIVLIYPLVSEAQDRYVFMYSFPEGPGFSGKVLDTYPYSPFDLAVDSSENVYVVDTGNNRIQKLSKYGDLLASWGVWGNTGDGKLNYPRSIAIDKSGNIYIADTDSNRIQKFNLDGNFLSKWGGKGSGNSQFIYPSAIAVDTSGNVYVVDTGNNRIQKFDSNGNFMTKWGSNGSGDGQFDSPEGIGIDSSGNVYIADKVNERIQKFDSNGNFLKKWGKLGYDDGEFLYPRDVAIDSSDNVYVSDGTNDTRLPISFRKNRIQIFDPEGNFIGKWGDIDGSGDGKFSVPRGIDIGPSGDIYVADSGNYRVQVFDPSGLFLTKWGIAGTGDGQFRYPRDVAVDTSGNLYVVDYHNHRIQKLDKNGNFLGKWGAKGIGDGNFTYPSGIAIDPSGNIYVSDMTNRIQKFDSFGRLLGKWGTMGSGDGQFMTPAGIAVDLSGNVYVADIYNNRIQKFDSFGKFLLKWGTLGGGNGGKDGDFNLPRGVAVDTSGNVYVADTDNHRIQKFNSNGAFLGKWGGPGNPQFYTPWGVTTDVYGNVFVSDYNHHVQKFDSSGKLLADFGLENEPAARFCYPNGMAVDTVGNVYVADSGNQCIKVYRKSAGNNAPIANPKMIVTFEDVPIQFVLTGRDPDGDSITFKIVNQPTYGSLTGSPPDLTYSPNLNFFGSDSFAFAVWDGRVESKSATVQIFVASVNDPPTADSKTLETDEDIPLDITLAGSDPDNNPLTFKITDPPKNGVLTGTAPKLTYTPYAEFSGTDSFTYVVNDGFVDSTPAIINLTIKMVNDPPVANPDSAKVDEDSPVQFTLTGSDPEGDPLTFSVVTQTSNGTLSGIPPNLTYTPNPDFFGSDGFTFTVNDGYSTCQSATFSITVNPVNDKPVAESMSISTTEDKSVSFILKATDKEKDVLTYKITKFPLYGKAQFLTPPQMIYVPNKDYYGTDSFTFAAMDASDESESATVTITVEPVNDQPIANTRTINTQEDTPVKIILTGNDIDNTELTYKRTSDPTHGTLDGTAPELNYTPNPNFFGEDSFKFTISDGSLESSFATIKIIIDPVNDPPTADFKSATTNEGGVVDIVLTGSDIESDPLTFKVVTEPAYGFLSGNPPNLKYKPNEGFSGTDSFTFAANDGKADSQPEIVSIKVNKINHSPYVALVSVTTDEDTPIKIPFTGTDPDNDPLTFKIASQPLNGTLDEIAPDFIYTPKLNFSGNDSFTFIANDGEFNSNIGTVSIIVKPVNDAPIPNPQSVETDEDTPAKITLTATDPEGDVPITFKIVENPLNGTLSGTPPKVTYTPNANFNGEDSFTFTASDGKLDSNPEKVNIIINSVNDPPVVTSQSVETDEDTQVKIALIATDIDGDTLTFNVTVQPTNGTLSGTTPELTYEPKYGFGGDDSFTFIANDGTIDSAPVTVKITINPMTNPYDVNRDGIVNILDLAIVSMYYGKETFPFDHNPDVNRDHKVDAQDIDIVIKNFGKKL